MWTLLVWWIAAVAAARSWGDDVESLELSKPFVSHDFENHNYEYGGSAILAKNYVRLTSDLPDQRGWIVSRQNTLPKDFQLSMEFKIDGKGKSMYGDGMVLWFLPEHQPVSEGSMFGLQDKFVGTALIIDTYRNHRPGKAFPYIMVMQNDGHQVYDAANDGKSNELAGFSARGLHHPTSNSQLRVTYHENSDFTVEINYRGRWETCFSKPLNLGGTSKIALSATTGQLSEQHDIYGLKVSQLDPQSYRPAHSEKVGSEYASQFAQEKKSGWTWFLVKVLFFAGVSYGGFKYWAARKKTSRSPDPFQFS